MDELIELVSERARISESEARRAIETVFSLVHADEIAIESSQGMEIIGSTTQPQPERLTDLPDLAPTETVCAYGSTSLH